MIMARWLGLDNVSHREGGWVGKWGRLLFYFMRFSPLKRKAKTLYPDRYSFTLLYEMIEIPYPRLLVSMYSLFNFR